MARLKVPEVIELQTELVAAVTAQKTFGMLVETLHIVQGKS